MDTKNYLPSRRGFLKGLAVGAGGYVLGSFLIHPNEVLGQSIEDYLGKIPMEARWNAASGGLVHFQVNYFKKLLDTEGREKLVEFTRINSSAAGAGGKRIADRFGMTGTDAKSAATILPALVIMAYGPQQKFEIAEATENRAVVKCLECAFWNNVQAKKITDDICSSNSHYYWEGCAKAINPKLNSTLVKARPRGDSLCEWVFELKA
jgi:hypothetical protein